MTEVSKESCSGMDVCQEDEDDSKVDLETLHLEFDERHDVVARICLLGVSVVAAMRNVGKR